MSQEPYFDAMWTALSPARLGSYRYGNDDEVGVLSTYLLQWISPPLDSTIALNDRFTDVLAGGRHAYRDGVGRVKRMTDGGGEIARVPALFPVA